ncbi:MAG: lysylphosphatidylglycerol synthase transmembrane domain-containing protein [Burkholderiaceae bacterium]
MTRTIALRIVAVLISIGLLWWLVADARWAGVGARLSHIDAVALAGVALLFAASYAMRGARIHGEFREEIGRDGRRTYARILRLTLVHNALVNVLPFRSGEAAFPVLLSRWFGIGTGRAVVSLLWLRAQDATVVLALAALVWPGLAIVWRVVALIAIVGGAWAVPDWARRHRVASTSPRLAKIQALLERSTRRNLPGWLWTIGNWSVKLVAEAWLVALALGPHDAAGRSAAVLGAIGAELAAILPIQGVAGFGTFEAGGAALMRTQGVALTDGLEAVLVLHAVVLALALVAGALAALLLPGPSAATDRG